MDRYIGLDAHASGCTLAVILARGNGDRDPELAGPGENRNGRVGEGRGDADPGPEPEPQPHAEGDRRGGRNHGDRASQRRTHRPPRRPAVGQRDEAEPGEADDGSADRLDGAGGVANRGRLRPEKAWGTHRRAADPGRGVSLPPIPENGSWHPKTPSGGPGRPGSAPGGRGQRGDPANGLERGDRSTLGGGAQLREDRPPVRPGPGGRWAPRQPGSGSGRPPPTGLRRGAMSHVDDGRLHTFRGGALPGGEEGARKVAEQPRDPAHGRTHLEAAWGDRPDALAARSELRARFR
jgi:hypothetical protein